MRIVVVFKQGHQLALDFDTQEEMQRNFDIIQASMSKITLDIWYSDKVVIKIPEIAYIYKDVTTRLSPKVDSHWEAETFGYTVCGEKIGADSNITINRNKVTCKKCLS